MVEGVITVEVIPHVIARNPVHVPFARHVASVNSLICPNMY